ncbi:MAG: hypothetical protein RJA57_1959 [Bacteroidota bacterium]
MFAYVSLPILPVLGQPLSENAPPYTTPYVPAVTTVFYRLGDRTIPLETERYGPETGVICINLHDNEQTSVLAARAVLERQGGTLIRIGNERQRVIRFRMKGHTYSFDPNRMFSDEGIEQTLKENGRYDPEAARAVGLFAERILNRIPSDIGCIVALHNNTEALFSVKSYVKGGERETDARDVFVAQGQDEDDIALTTDEALFRGMAAKGYHSIWQDNINVKQDGSLSVFCGNKGLRYINIETQHGRRAQYEEMLNVLLQLLAEAERPTEQRPGEEP